MFRKGGLSWALEPYNSPSAAAAAAAAAGTSLWDVPSSANLLAALAPAGGTAAAAPPFPGLAAVDVPHQGKPRGGCLNPAAWAAPAGEVPSPAEPQEVWPAVALNATRVIADTGRRGGPPNTPTTAAIGAQTGDGAAASQDAVIAAAADTPSPSNATAAAAFFGPYANTSLSAAGRRLLQTGDGDFTGDFLVRRGNTVYGIDVKVTTNTSYVANKDGVLVLSGNQDILIQASWFFYDIVITCFIVWFDFDSGLLCAWSLYVRTCAS